MKKYQKTQLTRFKYFFILIACFCMPLLAKASAVEQFKNFLINTQSARGEFAQVHVRQKDGKNLRMGSPSTGIFLFSKPGKFIWNYKKPYEQILQTDGQKLYIYDKDLNQVTTKKLGAALGASPAAILFGSTDIEKNFTLSEDGIRSDLEWMKATPKDRDSTFLFVNIGMKNNVPVAMEIYDSLGQISLIKLIKFENNPVLPANTFKFVLPKGVDIFEN